jgi:hypothetical protein
MDSLGNPAYGIVNATASSYVEPDLLGGNVSYDLDCTSITPNLYYGSFSIQPQASDNKSRVLVPDVQIRVLPYVEVVATFDPSTARGRLRQELQDISDFIIPGTAVGITSPTFSDSEVDAFLYQASPLLAPQGPYTALNNQTVYMAAYYGWINIASTKANLVKVQRILFIQSSTQSTYEAAIDMANRYLTAAGNEANALFSSPAGEFYERQHRMEREYRNDAPWNWE